MESKESTQHQEQLHYPEVIFALIRAFNSRNKFQDTTKLDEKVLAMRSNLTSSIRKDYIKLAEDFKNSFEQEDLKNIINRTYMLISQESQAIINERFIKSEDLEIDEILGVFYKNIASLDKLKTFKESFNISPPETYILDEIDSSRPYNDSVVICPEIEGTIKFKYQGITTELSLAKFDTIIMKYLEIKLHAAVKTKFNFNKNNASGDLTFYYDDKSLFLKTADGDCIQVENFNTDSLLKSIMPSVDTSELAEIDIPKERIIKFFKQQIKKAIFDKMKIDENSKLWLKYFMPDILKEVRFVEVFEQGIIKLKESFEQTLNATSSNLDREIFVKLKNLTPAGVQLNLINFAFSEATLKINQSIKKQQLKESDQESLKAALIKVAGQEPRIIKIINELKVFDNLYCFDRENFLDISKNNYDKYLKNFIERNSTKILKLIKFSTHAISASEGLEDILKNSEVEPSFFKRWSANNSDIKKLDPKIKKIFDGTIGIYFSLMIRLIMPLEQLFSNINKYNEKNVAKIDNSACGELIAILKKLSFYVNYKKSGEEFIAKINKIIFNKNIEVEPYSTLTNIKIKLGELNNVRNMEDDYIEGITNFLEKVDFKKDDFLAEKQLLEEIITYYFRIKDKNFDINNFPFKPILPASSADKTSPKLRRNTESNLSLDQNSDSLEEISAEETEPLLGRNMDTKINQDLSLAVYVERFRQEIMPFKIILGEEAELKNSGDYLYLEDDNELYYYPRQTIIDTGNNSVLSERNRVKIEFKKNIDGFKYQTNATIQSINKQVEYNPKPVVNKNMTEKLVALDNYFKLKNEPTQFETDTLSYIKGLATNVINNNAEHITQAIEFFSNFLENSSPRNKASKVYKKCWALLGATIGAIIAVGTAALVTFFTLGFGAPIAVLAGIAAGSSAAGIIAGASIGFFGAKSKERRLAKEERQFANDNSDLKNKAGEFIESVAEARNISPN